MHKLAKILIDEDLNVESSSIIEYFQDKQERDSITKILFSKNQSGEIEEIVSDCLIILKSNPIKEKYINYVQKIREKESNGENPMQELNAITELREKLNDLKKIKYIQAFSSFLIVLSIGMSNLGAINYITYQKQRDIDSHS